MHNNINSSMADSTQQRTSSPATTAPPPLPNGSCSGCPPHVLAAIYGKVENKKEALDISLQRWWSGERLGASLTDEVAYE